MFIVQNRVISYCVQTYRDVIVEVTLAETLIGESLSAIKNSAIDSNSSLNKSHILKCIVNNLQRLQTKSDKSARPLKFSLNELVTRKNVYIRFDKPPRAFLIPRVSIREGLLRRGEGCIKKLLRVKVPTIIFV